MKNSFKILAIALLFSSSSFAMGNKPAVTKPVSRDSVYFNALKDNRGVSIRVKKQETGYTIVSLYDDKRSLILSQHLPEKIMVEQRYILGDAGTYYFVVESKGQKIEKKVTVSFPEQQTIDINN